MPIRQIVRTIAASGAVAAALACATPALAGELPGADMANAPLPAPLPAPPPLPAAPPRLPDSRPVWTGDAQAPAQPPQLAPAAMQVDPRTRDSWLAECRRRMDTYYSSGWDDDYGWKRRRNRDGARGRGHEYCETYFDDYYRQNAQAYEAYLANYSRMAERYRAQQGPAGQNCVEEEHITYEPVRTRYIPRRRVIHDKRIRIQ